MADQLHPAPLVLVDQGRITDVDTTGADPPEGAELVNLEGATLLPGLVDSHTHLVFDASNDPVGHLAGTDDDALLEQCRTRARAALTAGSQPSATLATAGSSPYGCARSWPPTPSKAHSC